MQILPCFPLLVHQDTLVLAETWKIIVTSLLGVCVLVALVKEVFNPALIMLFGALVLVVSGIVSIEQFFAGYLKQVIFVLAFLFVVVRALEVNGVLNMALKWIAPKSSFYPIQILSFMFPVGVLSGFLNNTPLVLLLTPMVQKWAHLRGAFASKYLIPLSYAAILGGSCTLIGTSTNLVVDSMLYHQFGERLSFFELGKIGLPALLLGILYIAFFGHRLLPSHKDPKEDIEENSDKEMKEFEILEFCPLIGKSIVEVSESYFEGGMLLEIEREGDVIYSPKGQEILRKGDRLVFLCEIEELARLHTTEGLKPCEDPHFEISGLIPHIIEAVITKESGLIGKSIEDLDFRNRFGGLVLRIIRERKKISSSNLKKHLLQAGDTLLILIDDEESLKDPSQGNDLCLIKEKRQVQRYSKSKAMLSMGILVGMIFLALIGLPMFYSSMLAAVAVIATRCLSPAEITKSIRWGLLILIGSTYSFAMALETTGIAHAIARSLIPVMQIDQHLFIAGTFLMVAITTEVITNTAAVLILFPIVSQIAILSGFEGANAHIAVAVTTAIAGSCAFMSPIGYQTNTIVYGPGGYKFLDYTRVGLPLTLLLLLLSTWMVPLLWPF